MPTPDELILALLRARPQHGYQLLEAFHDPARLAHIWKMSTAQIYAVLKRLERDGEIRGVAVESANAPTRTEFHITAQGEARLMAWLGEAHLSSSIRRIRVEFLSRIYAADVLELPIAPLVARQHAACVDELERLQNALADAPSASAALALSLQLAQMEAVITWMMQTFEEITTR